MSNSPEIVPGLERPYFVYMVRCRDGSFYVGVTDDLERRLMAHNAGVASRYTRARRPVELWYYERCENRQDAIIRSCALRLLSKKEKEALGGKGQDKE
jgi:putative endonuclease